MIQWTILILVVFEKFYKKKNLQHLRLQNNLKIQKNILPKSYDFFIVIYYYVLFHYFCLLLIDVNRKKKYECKFINNFLQFLHILFLMLYLEFR